MKDSDVTPILVVTLIKPLLNHTFYNIDKLLLCWSYSMTIYNAITQNICSVKGSHKYDVYMRDKNKYISTDQIKTAFRFSMNATRQRRQ